MSRIAQLTRTATGDTGTFGRWISDSGKSYYSGELPWRDNAPDISCIPTGMYDVINQYSPKHGCNLYHVVNVPGRDAIEIHPANWFGDKSLSLKCDMLGCIGLGSGSGILNGQQAILQSSNAIAEMTADFGGEPFVLTIVENYGTN
jgi:Family of unknown function (DUF5675)